MRPRTRQAGKRLPFERKRPVGLVSVMAAGLIVAMSPLAAAEPCPTTDPQCTLDQVRDTVQATTDQVGDTVQATTDQVGDTVQATTDQVGDTVEATTGPVTAPPEETVDQASDTVQRTVGQVNEPVDETVETVEDTVDSTLPPVTEPPPPAPDPPAGGTTRRTSGALRGAATVSSVRDAAKRAPPEPVAEAPAPRPSVPELLSASDAARPPSDKVSLAASSQPDDARKLPGMALPEEILGSLAFPLLLAASMVAFLVMQDRLDRSDPKLVKAPTEGDTRLLRFQ